MRRTSIIPKAVVGRMLMNAGSKRVSLPAVNAFTDIVTDIAERTASKAAEIAKHSGRKTVQEEDIKLAAK